MLARKIIEWIEGHLRLTHGPLAGEEFKLFQWQRAFIRGTFRPSVGRSALSIPRGPGKTTLVSGLAAAAVRGPLAVPRGEVLLVASSLNQAAIAFEDVLAFLKPFMGQGQKRDWRIQNSRVYKEIEHTPSGIKVIAMASDSKRAHGKRPTLVLADEPAQWVSAHSERMYAALSTALVGS